MKPLKYQLTCFFWLLSALTLTGFGSSPRTASQTTSFAAHEKGKHEAKVTEAELQDDLLRFEAQFNARLQSANQRLETSHHSKTRYRALSNLLVYGSNSLNIALGPSPEANLLDMVTFVELSRHVLERHWVPEVFGKDGQDLEQAFNESAQQIWAIADKVLNAEQKSSLQAAISAWLKKHPDQINVETVRLSAFSTEAGAKAAGLDQDISGLFSSVQQSTQAVDSARLFAERALYYAERAPFLFRLQGRLGADEIIDDAHLNLSQLSGVLDHERTFSKLMKELRETLLVTQATLNDAHSTFQSAGTLSSATVTINGLTHLLKEWNRLLSSPATQRGASQMAGIASQVDLETSRFLKKLGWLSAGLIALFWILFVLAKLLYHYFAVKISNKARSSTQDEHRKKAA